MSRNGMRLTVLWVNVPPLSQKIKYVAMVGKLVNSLLFRGNMFA